MVQQGSGVFDPRPPLAIAGVTRGTLVHSDPLVFERVLNAWKMEAQDQLVADATVREDVLFIRTCALETIEIEMRELKPFKEAKSEELLDFEIASARLFEPSLQLFAYFRVGLRTPFVNIGEPFLNALEHIEFANDLFVGNLVFQRPYELQCRFFWGRSLCHGNAS